MLVKRLVRTTVKLDEPCMRLAEVLARRCDVTVPDLFEALLLACIDVDGAEIDGREPELVPPPIAPQIRERSPRRRSPAKVISISEARCRRSSAGMATAEHGTSPGALCRHSRALRARAREVCINAERARARSAQLSKFAVAAGW
jgi:hypothetical protein